MRRKHAELPSVRKSGEIVFDGRPIGRRSPEAVVRTGIAHVPEGPEFDGRLAERTVA